MYGFLIKKSFCDGWDNLLLVLITNVIGLFFILAIVLASSGINALFGKGITPEMVDQEVPAILWLIQGVLFLLLCIGISILCFAFGEMAAKIADFDGVHIADFFKAIPGVLKDAILFGLMIGVGLIILVACLFFYFFQGNSIISFMAGALLFWLAVICILSLQWFIPLRSNMHNNFGKCLKKCFIIFFDNTGFSILVFLYTIILTAISVFMMGFLPSFAGILINKANALRIRLYKYDYLEEHPEIKTKKERNYIPWDELIQDDKDALGPRKLRSFLFPWKDIDNQQ